VRRRREDSDLSREPIPVALHGLDDRSRHPGIAHRLADLRQTIAQRVFLVALLGGAGPEFLQQLQLGHGLARMLHEIR
jgi:hypothetical protein